MRQLVLAMLLVIVYTARASDLVVHEWGTFTAFMGSDGKRQTGLHHEEEPLPNFVYGFHNPQGEPSFYRGMRQCGKIPCELVATLARNWEPLETMPTNPIGAGVTQKMETPVIYFYGDVGQKVLVNIHFPQGIISQYYPRASNYFPKYSDVSSLGPSQFSFDVELLAKDSVGNLPPTTSKSVWNPSREVKANTINVDGENEKFIFYRGVGDFDAQFIVKSDENNLALINLSPEKITHAFVLSREGSFGVIHAIGAIDNEKTVPMAAFAMKLPFEVYVQQAKSMIAQALVENGLFEDEARALVNTWERSYFGSAGLRVLYVVPRIETDKIIPLEVSPAPAKLVRTLIGRVEIMTKRQEKAALDLIALKPSFDPKLELGHFYEPKLRRLLEIARGLKDKNSALLERKVSAMLQKI